MTDNINTSITSVSVVDDDTSSDDPDPNNLLTLVVQCEAWASLGDLERIVNRVLNTVGARVPAVAGREVAVVLADDAELCALNERFRGQNKPTNVLSFPQADDPAPRDSAVAPPLGDIVIAYETVMREAQQENKPSLHHLTHMIVHGLLHLAGHDHESNADAEQMEALECEILANMDIPNPYNSIANGIPARPDRRCK
jgi:probable rRNA maturation factor